MTSTIEPKPHTGPSAPRRVDLGGKVLAVCVVLVATIAWAVLLWSETSTVAGSAAGRHGHDALGSGGGAMSGVPSAGTSVTIGWALMVAAMMLPPALPLLQTVRRLVVRRRAGANYRQKHGLFAALIAEPPRSQWHTPDQEITAWAGAEAVVVPPTNTGVPPFRDFCLAVGDFVPLLDRGGRALNPPGELSGDDDPGSMAVNYRSTPLTFRGPDPSTWFSTQHDVPPDALEEKEAREPEVEEGEVEEENGLRPVALPDTPTIRSYPGERLRIRLIQGSHEEQHSFVMHGMRWPREWHNPASVLVNQQTLGISEAFTLDVDPAARSQYGPGDHLWRFNNIDDTWLGCWGLWRVGEPGPGGDPDFPRCPSWLRRKARCRCARFRTGRRRRIRRYARSWWWPAGPSTVMPRTCSPTRGG
jgi:hypothetical protein